MQSVNGSICTYFLSRSWEQSTTRLEILLGLFLFLKIEDQCPYSPLDRSFIDIYVNDKEKYKKLVENYCIEYAAPSEADLLLIKQMEEEDNNNLKNNNSYKGLISVIINCIDKNILCPIICKADDIFVYVECSFYEKYPDYKDTENYFLVNGNKINKYRTLKENGIKDCDIILLNIIENDNSNQNIKETNKKNEHIEYQDKKI